MQDPASPSFLTLTPEGWEDTGDTDSHALGSGITWPKV